jgi:hypothetical protein
MASTLELNTLNGRRFYYLCKYCGYKADAYLRVQAHQNKNKNCKNLKIDFFARHPEKEFENAIDKIFENDDDVPHHEMIFPQNLTFEANSSDHLLYSILRQGNRNMGISQV